MHRARASLASIAAAALLTMPATASAQRAGTLVSAEPVGSAPDGMRAWRVRYRTLSDRNQPIEVSGMVIAPARPAGGSGKVIAWTHGMIGVAQRCAPSKDDTNFTMIPSLADVIARGYTVVAPDYPGLGSSLAHPALVGVSTGRSVLDAVRAARDIRGANTGLRFAVWGESQGGHAALWTGQLARSYAPELNLMGVAAIVPPTDLARNMMEGSDKNARALLTAYTATSWSRHYGIPMSALGNRSTQTIMTRLSDNYCIETHKKPKLSTILGIVTVQRAIRNLDLSKQQPWGRLMRENSVSPASAPSPLLIATGSADVIVAPAVVRDFARRACRAGKAVRYISIPGGEHATVARTEAAQTLDWIDARFAGQRAPSDCGRI
ncbi:alpha/beta fold hydrolase [Sphingomonas koreensis]|nr:alpha/beta fold hydrolase [Sphingomonas koreensis]